MLERAEQRVVTAERSSSGTDPGDRFEIRPAHAGDAAEIAALIATAFDAELIDAMVYGCHGMERYIRAQIEVPDALAERRFTVATRSGERTLAGCVELRHVSGGLFLNYIATSVAARGRRLAGPLLRTAIHAANADPAGFMRLDVFASNHIAGAWYERLGLRETSRSEWWGIATPSRNETSDVRHRKSIDQTDPLDHNDATEHLEHPGRAAAIADLPQADVTHAAFGFSQITVVTSSGSFPVGRLGDAWFRVTSADALRSAEVLDALHTLDARRSILAILPGGALPDALGPSARRLVESRRLETPIAVMLEQLAMHSNDQR